MGGGDVLCTGSFFWAHCRFLNGSETLKQKTKITCFDYAEQAHITFLYPYFSDEEATGQRGQVTSPRSHS